MGGTVGYADEHLLPQETIVYRTSLHWVVFLLRGVIAAFLLLLTLTSLAAGSTTLGIILLFSAALLLGWAFLEYKTSEFAVTDKRVLVKDGVMNRRSLELLLNKIEGISVNQGLLGRVLGYGTIVVNGTGGTKERFKSISEPFDFRKQVQAQVEASKLSRL
jgi:uncharacterized membrane protein YdbT with pleckstrin-like domain